MFEFYYSYSLPAAGGDVGERQPAPISERAPNPPSQGPLWNAKKDQSVLADERIPDPVFRTYYRLRVLAGGHSRLAFSDQDFQEFFGVSRRTLYRHLALLAKLDVLRYISSGSQEMRWYQVEFLEDDNPGDDARDSMDCPGDNAKVDTNSLGGDAKTGTDWTGDGAKTGTDWLGDHAKVGTTFPENGDKVGTYLINTSSSSSLTPVNFNKNKLNRGGKEEEEVNIKSAKNGNPLPALVSREVANPTHGSVPGLSPGELPAHHKKSNLSKKLDFLARLVVARQGLQPRPCFGYDQGFPCAQPPPPRP